MTFTHLGFTGTRGVLTHWQCIAVDSLLRHYKALGFTHFHHGDCVGADQYTAYDAKGLGFIVVAHPPTNEKLRAYVPADETRPALSYLERNAQIVAESHVGIGVPNTEIPVTGSGTWWTIHRFAQSHTPYWIVSPTTMWSGS